MKQANKDFLKRYEHNYQTLKQADFIGHLELGTRQELLRIVREEFDANYTMCLTCTEDVFQLVKFVYSQAEKAQAKEDAAKSPEDQTKQDKPEATVTLTKKATFPKQERIR